jgi:hypothetical protein
MERDRQAGAALEAGARIALLQGAYDVVTGVWPIVHLRSFEAATGPMFKGWLMKTIGALVTGIGGTLLFAGLRRRVTPGVRMLGVGSAAAFAVMGLSYAPRWRTFPFIPLDALVEGALIAGWGVAVARERAGRELSASPSRQPWETADAPVPMADAAGLEQPMP